MKEEKDIIIVGFGGAGATAALEAADQGASVLLVDRFKGGGATAISGGIIYAGGGTPYQKYCGFRDTPENMYQYLKHEVGDCVSSETLKRFCGESVQNLSWLQGKGVPFSPKFYPKKTSYPPESYFFYYSGNELFNPYKKDSEPVPRGHRVKGPGFSGRTFFLSLKKAVESHEGISVRVQTKVDELIVEGGKVRGVRVKTIKNPLASFLHSFLSWSMLFLRYVSIFIPPVMKFLEKIVLILEKKFSESEDLYAKKGVILSSGGFIFNRDMVKEFAPQYKKGFPLGTIGDDGSGIKMGQAAGGDVSKMNRVTAWMFFVPPSVFAKGLLVNRKGQRICNEEHYGATVGDEMALHHEGESYLIIDASIWNEAFRQTLREPHAWFQVLTSLTNLMMNRKKSSSLEGLAFACGIDTEGLLKTVKVYNEESVDSFEKSKGNKRPLEGTTFYAVRCFLDNKLFPCPTLTLGGLKVDEESGAVLRSDGSKIEGLYAAGRNAVGLSSHSYVSGLSLSDCVFSGRRAGKYAAETKSEKAAA